MSENCDELKCLERNKFFDGKFITAKDLIKEQQYIIEKNKLHNRMLGHGVVYGLKVKKAYPLETKVIIEPGHAIDCCGNDIVVCTEKVVDIADKIKECRTGGECSDAGPVFNVEKSIDDFTGFPPDVGSHQFKGLQFITNNGSFIEQKHLHFELFTLVEIIFPEPVTRVSLEIRNKLDDDDVHSDDEFLNADAKMDTDTVGTILQTTADNPDWNPDFEELKINKIVIKANLRRTNVSINKISWVEESKEIFTNFAVALKYAECEKEPVPVHGIVCGGDRQCNYNTIKETYEVELLCRDEFPPGCADMALNFDIFELILSKSSDEKELVAEKAAEIIKRYTEQIESKRKRDLIYSGPEHCKCPQVFLAIISISGTGKVEICNLFRNHVYTIPMFLYYLEMILPINYGLQLKGLYYNFCTRGISDKTKIPGLNDSSSLSSRILGLKSYEAKKLLDSRGIQSREISTSILENFLKFEPDMFAPDALIANLVGRDPVPEKGKSVDLVVDNKGIVIDYSIRKEPAEVEVLRKRVRELEETSSFSYRMKDRVFDRAYVPHYSADVAHLITDGIIMEIPLTKVTGITEENARKISALMPEIMSISDLVDADPVKVAEVTGEDTDDVAKSINSASRLLRKVAKNASEEMKSKKVLSIEEIEKIDFGKIGNEVDLPKEVSDSIKSRLLLRNK